MNKKNEIETMEQNYYTVDEAMAILEPRIRTMFEKDFPAPTGYEAIAEKYKTKKK